MSLNSSADDRIQKVLDASILGDPTFWRHPLAEAVISLLERQKEITLDTIITRLEEGFPEQQGFLKGSKTISATIQHLIDVRIKTENKVD